MKVSFYVNEVWALVAKRTKKSREERVEAFSPTPPTPKRGEGLEFE